MNISLAANLVLLAQGYDDTGAASRSSILIGILALPCLIIIAAVWQKLKNAKESDGHIERLNRKIEQLEENISSKPAPISANPPSQSPKIPLESLTEAQRKHFDEVVARAGKPNAALQREIDEFCVAKTENELKEIFLKGANIERPSVEAELLCLVMLAKQAELNPNINAEALGKEHHAHAALNQKIVGLCPSCKSEVLEGSTGYFCRKRECGFKLNGVIMGQFLSPTQATKLLQNGRTDLLSGFVTKEGRQFPAFLIVDNSGKVTFDFPNQNIR